MNSNFNSSRSNLAVTVSGSFHRHMSAISSVVHELAEAGVRVLSPSDPRIVAAQGEFLFVASDPVRSVRLVQDRHLDCVRAADFLWLVCPDGYVGQSASMEIGFAAALGVPIYALHTPTDLTLRQYVTVVPALSVALRVVAKNAKPVRAPGLLINPHASVEEAHDILSRIGSVLSKENAIDEPAVRVHQHVQDLWAKLHLPTPIQ
jgi:hypothetical protein